MNLLRALLLTGVVAAGLTSAPALGEPPRDSKRAFEGRRVGHSMPLPQLELRVMPLVGPNADYLGPELNGQSYRMKFIQNGRVIWVDVDPQTGRILRRSRDR
jgi:hypothetical protein